MGGYEARRVQPPISPIWGEIGSLGAPSYGSASNTGVNARIVQGVGLT